MIFPCNFPFNQLFVILFFCSSCLGKHKSFFAKQAGKLQVVEQDGMENQTMIANYEKKREPDAKISFIKKSELVAKNTYIFMIS